LIAIIYAVVAAINKVQGTSISALGIIMGALAVAGAFILNLVIGCLNAIIQLIWSILVEPLFGIIEWILNAVGGGFDSLGGAVANLVGQIIGWFLSLGKVVTTIIDAIFGTNWTGGLEALREDVTSWGKNEEAITIERTAPTLGSRIEYGSAWDSGYDFGAGIANKVTDFFGGFSVDEYAGFNPDEYGGYGGYNGGVGDIGDIGGIGNIPTYDQLKGMAGDIGDIKTNTDALEITSEHLKYLRDAAEQEVINRFTTAEIRVDMGGVTNNVNQNMDLDGVIDYMVTGAKEAMERVAEGVH
jgi:hypothetical protein